MKVLGTIMIVIAVAVIGYNLCIYNENKKEMRNSPFTTLLTGGANLKPCYTFAPPYSGFEIFIFAVGGLGVIFLFWPQKEIE